MNLSGNSRYFPFAFLFSLYMFGQSYSYYDTLSIRLLAQGKFDSVLYVTNEATVLGYDGYYLRLRRGIAFLQNNNYEHASKELKKALYFNSREPLALKYLYMSYLFTKSYRKAQWLTRQMPMSLRNELHLEKPSIVDLVKFYVGYENQLIPNGTPAPLKMPPLPQYSTSTIQNAYVSSALFNLNTKLFSWSMKYSYNTYTLLTYQFEKNFLLNTSQRQQEELSLWVKPSIYVKNSIISLLFSELLTHSLLQEQTSFSKNLAGGLNLQIHYSATGDHYLSFTGFGTAIQQMRGIGVEVMYYYPLKNTHSFYGNTLIHLFSRFNEPKNILIEQCFSYYRKRHNTIFFTGFGSLANQVSHDLFFWYTYPSVPRFYAGIDANLKLLNHLWLNIKYVFSLHKSVYFFNKPDMPPLSTKYLILSHMIQGGILWK